MKNKKLTLLPLLIVLIIGVFIGFKLGQSAASAPEEIGGTTEASGQTASEASSDADAKPAHDIGQDSAGNGGGTLSEDKAYNSKEEVALYIKTYGHLPPNYVTKKEARDAGWEGGSLEPYFPGCSIGGDVFRNREGLLPKAHGRIYYECDIDSAGKRSRGAKRIVYSNDGLIYYSDDHFQTFTLLYGEE